MINKIAEDFEKIIAETKSNDLKLYAKNILPNYRTKKKKLAKELKDKNKKLIM